MWAVLQARMKSSRLPGKVLMPALDRPLIGHNIERILRARTIAGVVVATSDDASDDGLARACEDIGVPVHRGSDEDVLDRIYRCATARAWTGFAKLTADNPLIDPAVIDRVVTVYMEHPDQYDYVSNNHPPTWQDGQEVEVIRVSALERAWREAVQPFQREHVTPFIWDQPDFFRIANVARPDDDWYGRYRWTLDYPEDYEFMRRVFEELYPSNPAFDTEDLMAFLEARPEIHAINASHAGYIWYREHAGALRTVQGTGHMKEAKG